ncbi:ABC transporter substrate-binding protein [Usitatibacter palustris]|uniref:Heme-binding protein A n=1 Tax=Usitatibacter palustris TaxID=2732487 RepID=A0A6M4H165_9PROT|nr:ABC transporter substrate-binding protein [Usitatibacter palustris]QJR13236.1 Heme-binding protein A [Usitatibacter palustris]
MLPITRIALAALFFAFLPHAHAAKEREVSIGLQAAVSSIDPHYHNLSPNNSMLLHIYEGLTKRDANQKVVPGLATSWKAIDDLTWEIKLRKNVKFHDGSPFTADDVVFTLKRVPNVPNSPSSFATFTRPIVDVKVVDPHTLIFKTATPHVLLPSDLASVYIISKLNGEKAETSDYNSGKAAIGTGPYKLVEYIPNQRIVLKANYGYWGGEEPWDKVTFKVLSNSAARVAALLSGDVQMIESVPTADIAKLSKDPKLSLTDKVSNRVIYVHLNQSTEKAPPFVTAKDGKPLEKNPFRDARVRKALSMAINRDAIADRVMEKKGVPAAQLLPDIFYGTSRKLKVAKFDPEGAKKLLAEAGYPNGFALTIHGPNNRYINDDKIAQAIAQYYTRIGIDTKVETMLATAYFPRATKLEFGYMVLGWGTESGEQGSALRSLLATHDPAKGMGMNNRGRYSNPELDKALNDALVTMDDKKREGLIQHAAEVAMNDTGLIPIHYEVSTWASAKGFRYIPRTDQYTLASELKPIK